jgi:uncharacterized membrane protein (DUF373 family)
MRKISESMNLMNKILRIFYWGIIIALFIILIFSAIELMVLLGRTIKKSLVVFDFSVEHINKNELFLSYVQKFISGILLLTIIIELIQSFFIFLKSQAHSKYLVILYEIAMIAIVRHLFVVDFEHIGGFELLGTSVLVLVVGALNFFNKPEMIKKMTQLKSNTDHQNSKE